MSNILNDNFNTQFPNPIDNRYGPYNTIAEALAAIPLYRRYIGLTIGIDPDNVEEYWWKDGLTNADLVAKFETISYAVRSVNGQTGDVMLDSDDIPQGVINEYFTQSKVRATILTGLSTATNAIISATDSVLSAFGKLQAQITANLSTLTSHISNTSNPHNVTKAQVGLSNADNTSDANKPISTATQTALNAKQDTLVSGTNIKTINSTSLLGSGDISIQANPSGVDGAIQFSDGSAFASDATNLFWDNTNKRLGVGFNSPTARLQVRGSGSTSATTSLLVQNSAGTNLLRVQDDDRIYVNNIIRDGTSNLTGIFLENTGAAVGNGILFSLRNRSTNSFKFVGQSDYYFTISYGNTQGAAWFGNSASLITPNSSAQVQIDSTTKGFLPPRMTTTQKNAITSPAAGLVVYDSTTNKLCCYNGSTWNDLF